MNELQKNTSVQAVWAETLTQYTKVVDPFWKDEIFFS